MKKFRKSFDLKFRVTKNSWSPEPLQKIQISQYSLNEKIPKNFRPEI